MEIPKRNFLSGPIQMSNKKPEPMFSAAKPALCPVCGEASYSSAGIHPQCSVKQADEKRRVILKQAELDAAAANKPSAQKPAGRWEKTCPKCGMTLHVRKKICDCDYAFGKTKSTSD